MALVINDRVKENSTTSGTGNMGVGYNALNNLNSGGGNVALGRQV